MSIFYLVLYLLLFNFSWFVIGAKLNYGQIFYNTGAVADLFGHKKHTLFCHTKTDQAYLAQTMEYGSDQTTQFV